LNDLQLIALKIGNLHTKLKWHSKIHKNSKTHRKYTKLLTIGYIGGYLNCSLKHSDTFHNKKTLLSLWLKKFCEWPWVVIHKSSCKPFKS